ncbi:MAG: tetratricopeptide repeat protein [Bacteroidia bacterium]
MKKNIPQRKSLPKENVASMQLNPAAVASIKKIMMIVCAAFAFVLYANTLMHNYTVDDDTVIKNNKITKKGISALPEIFTTAYRAGFWERKESLYRPLSVAMFAIEYSIAPGKPFVGHLMNVLLYTLTAVILFMTLQLFFQNKNPIIAFIATLLFIAHPLHTEVVANIKSRDEILAFLFSISSLYAMLKYAQQQNMKQLILAGVFIFLALLSKENAITFVVVAPLTLYFFTAADKKQIITCTAVFAGAAALYFIVRIAVLGGATNFTEIQLINNSLVGAEGDFGKRIASATMIMGRYLMLLVFPHPLCFDYSYNTFPLVSFGDIRALISLVVIVALGVYAVKGFKTKDPVAYGILFFALTISLVSNFAFLIEATLGERFAYMPSLGFCIALAVLAAKFLKADYGKTNYKNFSLLFSENKNVIMVAGVILILFSVKTFSRNLDWKNNFTLLKHDVEIHPESARIRYAYGSELVLAKALKEDSLDERSKMEHLNEGIEQLEKGVSILPEYSDAWFNLGMAYKEKKDNKSAIRCFEKARSMKEFKEIDFYIASGIAYGEEKQFDKAFADLNKSIEIDPKSDEAYNNLGLYQTDANLFQQAIASLNKSIELKAANKNALYNLGNTYARMGDYNTAISYYQKAINVDPAYGDAYNNMGNSYAAMKDYNNALTYYTKLAQLQPGNSKVVHNIGVTYMILGDSVKGNQFMQQAQQMNGGR